MWGYHIQEGSCYQWSEGDPFPIKAGCSGYAHTHHKIIALANSNLISVWLEGGSVWVFEYIPNDSTFITSEPFKQDLESLKSRGTYLQRVLESYDLPVPESWLTSAYCTYYTELIVYVVYALTSGNTLTIYIKSSDLLFCYIWTNKWRLLYYYNRY